MHRRELTMIAGVIRTNRAAYTGIGTMSVSNRTSLFAVETLAKDIAKAMQEENPSFRTDLFFTACGMQGDTKH